MWNSPLQLQFDLFLSLKSLSPPTFPFVCTRAWCVNFIMSASFFLLAFSLEDDSGKRSTMMIALLRSGCWLNKVKISFLANLSFRILRRTIKVRS
jgi:hypothetical protein